VGKCVRKIILIGDQRLLGASGPNTFPRYSNDLRFKLIEIANPVTLARLLADNIQVIFIQQIR
jgi:hypothetical protein